MRRCWRLRQAGDRVGLVYTWYAHIDRTDRVLSLTHRPTAEGQVLREMLRANLVGNGSTALLRRAAFERAGGFDMRPECDGCEDLALCLRVAEHYEFRVVRRHLVGYRISPHNKSSNAEKMVRSCEAVLSDYRYRYPGLRNEMEDQLNGMRCWLLARSASAGRYDLCGQMARQLWR